MVLRARIVLLAWRNWTNAAIAAELKVSVTTVRTWRRRFVKGGLPALEDRPRSGRPATYGPDVRLRVIAAATSVPPEGVSVWTHTLIAGHLADTRISPSQVGRILAEADLRPHRVRGWLHRLDDEQFWAQAAAVCDLYLRPPAGTVLLSVDEKTGMQAKSRRHPDQSMRPGRLVRREFEYRRHGTVSIVAAMNVANGEVLSEWIARNDSVTFIGFLSRLEQAIAPDLAIHLIMDNGSSHTSRATRAYFRQGTSSRQEPTPIACRTPRTSRSAADHTHAPVPVIRVPLGLPPQAHTHAGQHLIGQFLWGQLAVQEHGVTRQRVGCGQAWLDLGLTPRPDPLILFGIVRREAPAFDPLRQDVR
ncbi:IS630 family transposase [Nonomuraea sp. NPDC049400]|uniref:IS630 family transposase n=1 Tax=Nonomuraea sp. NPDC049400 TaxID=3364352 RepID=UPI0037AC29C8